MEEQVNSIGDLEGLNTELEDFLSDLQGREEGLTARVRDLEERLAAAGEAASSASQRLAQKEASLSSALEEARAALQKESSRASALASEKDDLSRRLDTISRLFDEEKARSAEKDLYISGSRSAVKDKEAEAQKIWRAMEELKAELSHERDAVKEREERLQKAAKQTEALEKKLVQAAQDAARSEEGFSLKLELLKNELREQTRRASEIESRLAAAGSRLDEALEDAAHKEELLAGVREALAERDAQLKAANLKVRDLAKELEALRSGAGSDNAEKARALAESLSSRVEQLEGELAESSARSLEKFRASQAALSSAQSALRQRDEENAALKAKEETLLKEVAEAEEKWKFASAQLHNAVSKLRAAENRNEIDEGRIKSLEDERDKFRAAAIKAETTASALAAQEAAARDGEAAGLMASLEEQSSKYAALLRKYDDLMLANDTLAREKLSVQTEAESARAMLQSAEESSASALAAEKGRASAAMEKLRAAESALKLREAELASARSAAAAAEQESQALLARMETLESGSAGEKGAERARYAALSEKLRAAESALNQRSAELAAARAAASSAAEETQALLARMEAMETGASGEKDAERARYAALAERLRAAEGELKKLRAALDDAKDEASGAVKEAELLRERLERAEAGAAGAAEEERARYALLSEKMHNADTLLKKKEFELQESRAALAGLESECELLRRSREDLGEKYSREIQAENELLKQAHARIVERDSVIARLSVTEGELKKETEGLKKERQSLISLVRKKTAPASSVSEAEKLLSEKEGALMKLRAELERTRAEKAQMQGREKELREELKAKPYRAMLREAEEKLLIKEKMLADVNQRMEKIGRDFEELKGRGRSAGAPGYMPEFEELVAGVAHQIANSISIIRSHAEFCAEAPEADGARESLDVIVRNIVLLQKKIDTIMNFSRPVLPQRSPESLSAVASEALEKLRVAGKLDGIRTSLKGGDKLPAVSVDRVRLAAALEQLMLNAAEAMPSGGELAVTLSAAEGRQRVEISDTGEGIEKKNLQAVFHPFFTTKQGKMGLGLTLARNVARAHGGTLEISGGHGHGTRAVIELPSA